MEEKDEKVDVSFKLNLSNAEKLIAELKKDAPRIEALLDAALKKVFEECFKKAANA